jgi:hypothetical protein
MGVSVYAPGSPQFSETLSKLVDPADMGKIGALLPLCLVVKNGTGRYLAGITVVYTVPEMIAADGEPFRIRESARTALRDRSQMFAPGDLRLVSPVYQLQGTIGDNGAVRLKPIVDEDTLRLMELRSEQYGSRKLVASVDSIVTEDGYLYGPDEGKLLPEFNARLRAESDLKNEVLPLRGEALRESLRLKVANVRQPTDEYTRWKGVTVQRWQNHLWQAGEEAFRASLESADQFSEIKKGDQ